MSRSAPISAGTRRLRRPRRAAACLFAWLATACITEQELVARRAPDVSGEASPADSGLSEAADPPQPARSEAGVGTDAFSAEPPFPEGTKVEADGSAALLSEAGLPEAGVDATRCPSAFRSIVLVGKDGELHVWDPLTTTLTSRGRPSCLKSGGWVRAGTVDERGQLWLASGDGSFWSIDMGSLACTQLKLALEPIALTFVFDPETKQEWLYALQANVLEVIDPVSLARKPFGKLEALSLAGTRDGRLLAFADDPNGGVRISELDRDSADVGNAWTVARPPGYFAGGLVYEDDFWLAVGSDLLRVDLTSQSTSLVTSFAADKFEIYLIAASTCSAAK